MQCLRVRSAADLETGILAPGWQSGLWKFLSFGGKKIKPFARISILQINVNFVKNMLM